MLETGAIVQKMVKVCNSGCRVEQNSRCFGTGTTGTGLMVEGKATVLFFTPPAENMRGNGIII